MIRANILLVAILSVYSLPAVSGVSVPTPIATPFCWEPLD